MQIVALDSKPIISEDIDISGLKKLGVLSLYPRTEPLLVKQRLRGANIVLTNQVPISREAILSTNALKLICILGNDLSIVDLHAAAEKAIPVCYIPDYASQDIAQHTMALLLEMCSHVGYHNLRIHKGTWCASQDYCWWEKSPISLLGKTAGIIGCGTVGKAVSRLFNAFGMHVLGYDIASIAQFDGEMVSLDELLERSDVVSINCSVNIGTLSFFDQTKINRMKQGAILINTSSGKIVVEQDICRALEEGKLSGYATDTVSAEPISVHNPLLGAPNCILSAHCSCASIGARQNLINMLTDTIASFISGNPKNLVF